MGVRKNDCQSWLGRRAALANTWAPTTSGVIIRAPAAHRCFGFIIISRGWCACATKCHEADPDWSSWPLRSRRHAMQRLHHLGYLNNSCFSMPWRSKRAKKRALLSVCCCCLLFRPQNKLGEGSCAMMHMCGGCFSALLLCLSLVLRLAVSDDGFHHHAGCSMTSNVIVLSLLLNKQANN
jgi:hypothetical protein